MTLLPSVITLTTYTIAASLYLARTRQLTRRRTMRARLRRINRYGKVQT